MDESLFEYYDIHLHGLVVSNADEVDTDEPVDEPELPFFDC